MRRHRLREIVVAAAAAIALAAGCTAGTGTNSNEPQKSTHKPVTLNVWTFFTGRELNILQGVLNRFQNSHDWITIKLTGGKEPEDVLRAINSGTPPDVATEAAPDNSAKYCASGAWIDLAPYAAQDKLNLEEKIPKAALDYTAYQGAQCALPVLSDAYGLYYNKALFAKAGISKPPRTYSQLFADAKNLTEFNPDGSIKVAGFVPLSNFYEMPNFENGVWSGTRWYRSDAKSALASDPRWKDLLTWQKRFVEWYGHDKLTRFFAEIGGPNSEWTSSNAFEKGRVAMNLDGEWRTAFIAADKAKIDYGTAPFPVADDQTDLYGAGQIGGTILGVPRGSQHPADAWLVAKYLALNTSAETTLAKGLKNVPTTYAALKTAGLSKDPHFRIFLDIFSNPHSRYKEITPLGTADIDLLDAWVTKYLAGKSSLQAGLSQVATQINRQRKL